MNEIDDSIVYTTHRETWDRNWPSLLIRMDTDKMKVSNNAIQFGTVNELHKVKIDTVAVFVWIASTWSIHKYCPKNKIKTETILKYGWTLFRFLFIYFSVCSTHIMMAKRFIVTAVEQLKFSFNVFELHSMSRAIWRQLYCETSFPSFFI